mgnify:FL=1
MPRNFFRRVEVAFPIEEQEQERSIIGMLEDFLKDNEFATELKGNGRYLKVARRNRKPFSIQESLISASIEDREREELEERLRRSSGKPENQGKSDQKDT